MKNQTIAVFSFLMFCLPLTSNAVTDTFSGNGAFGRAFLFTQNGCQSGFGELFVFENSSRSKAVKNGFHGSSIFFDAVDFCTNQEILISGFTDTGIDFSKAPKSITASGSVPVGIFVFDLSTFQLLSFENKVINLTNLAFTQSSDFVRSDKGITHIHSQSTSSVFKSVSTVDNSSSTATFSGNILNPLDGTAFSIFLAEIGTSRGHLTTITR